MLMRLLRKLRRLILTEKFSLGIVFLSFIGFIFSIVIFAVCGDWEFSTVLSEEKVAQFGDFTGGVIGTLLAFAASLLYYIALKEQQKDVKTNQKSLDKQIEEFGKQVEELEMSREVYNEQSKTMSSQYTLSLIQHFENNFFAYFDIYLKVKEQIDRETQPNGDLLGFLNSFKKRVNYTELQGKFPIDAYRYTIKQYSEYYINNRERLSHYFRTLYRLVTVVTSSKVIKSEYEKMKYIKLIRSQLTDTELLLINYDIHSPYAGKARQVFYEYNLLKHLPILAKVEIRNKYKFTQTAWLKMTSFVDFITPNIISFVNEVCDNPDLPEFYSREYEYEPMKCVLKLEYSDDTINISIVCNDLRVLPKLFKNIICDVLYDLLFISQFKHNFPTIEMAEIDDSITGNTYLNYQVPIDSINKIVVDKK